MIDSNETVMYENGRDSGYVEGLEDGLGIKLGTIEPHPTEVIAIYFDMENLSLDKVTNIIEMLRDKFPDNKVIALPDSTNLESCSKDVLENIISMIAVIIEQL